MGQVVHTTQFVIHKQACLIYILYYTDLDYDQLGYEYNKLGHLYVLLVP